MTGKASVDPKAGLIITRTFNAPQEAVFAAFANADAIGQWWGPAGSAITVLHFDFRAGGKFHYRLDGAGGTMWGLFVYGNIVRPDEIEFTSSFSDEAGGMRASPFPMDFPLEIFNRVRFSESSGQTTVTLEGRPVRATEAQEAMYLAIIPNMEQGFAGTMDQLEKYLGR